MGKTGKGKKPRSKSKHKKIPVNKKYSKDGKGRSCPRCGAGTFLAIHKDRASCGKCKYSEKKAVKKE
jgi:ubiquitin-small subunit ribosomal protein S27Ae